MNLGNGMRVVAICAALAASVGCYKLDVGNGQLRCSVPDQTCPTHFHCASDGYCWKSGQNPIAVNMTDMTVVDLAQPPPQANKGAVVVSGGVTAQSAHYQIIMSTGQAPGGNLNAASSSYKLKSGLPALSQ